MLNWRLEAFERWKEMTEPNWARVHYPKIDYQNIYYYAAPKSQGERPQNLEDVDPKLLETYKKLGIPLSEQKMLAGVAVDAVFDSVSVASQKLSKAKLTRSGRDLLPDFRRPFANISDLAVKKYLGNAVVPVTGRHYFATLNSAAFSDGTFVYVAQRGCAARWSFPPISASMRRIQASSNAR